MKWQHRCVQERRGVMGLSEVIVCLCIWLHLLLIYGAFDCSSVSMIVSLSPLVQCNTIMAIIQHLSRGARICAKASMFASQSHKLIRFSYCQYPLHWTPQMHSNVGHMYLSAWAFYLLLPIATQHPTAAGSSDVPLLICGFFWTPLRERHWSDNAPCRPRRISLLGNANIFWMPEGSHWWFRLSAITSGD